MRKGFGGFIAFAVGVTLLAFILLYRAPKAIIAIIPGHWGSDPGATCPDGLEEWAINLRVANLLAEGFKKKGMKCTCSRNFPQRSGL